ncbi:MAG: septum formation initiator family protein [Flavobacteriales bacterium]|nr:septum formation initiator family protein [Flavobacteriales bacterium]
MRNKYTLTLVVFFIYMLFFDANDMISLMRLRGELNELEENKRYFKEQIDITRNDLNELLTNDQNLEKFAREKYLMKKENEDIFIIVEK